jgi:ATP-dependent DNA helicase RecG
VTTEDLQRLIEAGENLNVEFKSDERAALSDDDLVELIVCLANRPGSEPAWLLVGVEDDGRITGARPRHEAGRTDPARLTATISNRTRPSLTVIVRAVPIQGKEVLAIEVPVNRSPVGTSKGLYLRRSVGGDGRPTCLPMHFHEMQAHQSDRGLLDYSTLVIPDARWEDLDPLEFDRLRRSVRERRGRSDETLQQLPNLELAKALGAVEANGSVNCVRGLGLLLFGKEEALREMMPTHEVAFQVLRGQSVEVNDFMRWPLLRAMEEIEARFRARNKEKEILVGMLRVGVPDYSPVAFREGVANALIHRDYTMLGAVHIQWHDARIEVSNPGGFPEGVRLDNLLVTAPRPRNPLLADAFKRAGIVERTARGIDTIFHEQVRNGRPAPSYDRSDATSVVLVLPGGEANLDFVRLVVEQSQGGRILGLDETLLLNTLWWERTLTSGMASRLIQKPEAEARSALSWLAEADLVEPRGLKKGRTWQLSAAVYRRLGEKAAYVRQRGFEPLQQEQMVLQYVEKHGSISRSETAELCRIGSMQAYRLLKRLEKKKEIKRLGGSTKAVRYGKTSI